MKTMRSATFAAKPISCVTTSIVRPSAAICCITASTSPTSSGSNAEVGSIDGERAARETRDEDVTRQLGTAVIGGIHLEVAGVVYLFIGITLAAVPEEMAWLLRAIGL